jgi:hypothetical protein
MAKKSTKTQAPKEDSIITKKKLSAKVVCGNVKDHDFGFLFRVKGIAIATKTVETQYGISTGLKGEFVCTPDMSTFYVGPVLYLAEEAVLPIATQLQQEGVKKVEFSFDVYKVESSAPIGYEYEYRFVEKPSEMKSSLIGQMINLPALPEK